MGKVVNFDLKKVSLIYRDARVYTCVRDFNSFVFLGVYFHNYSRVMIPNQLSQKRNLSGLWGLDRITPNTTYGEPAIFLTPFSFERVFL